MQLLSSNSISIPFFLLRECLMPDIETGIVAVVFTQICHPAHQLFTSLFITFDIASSSFRTKSFSTPLPPVTPQIIPLPVSVNMNIVCDVQGLSSTLNLIQSHGHSWKPPGSTDAEATRLKNSRVFSLSLLNYMPSSKWAASTTESNWILIRIGCNHLRRQGKFDRQISTQPFSFGWRRWGGCTNARWLSFSPENRPLAFSFPAPLTVHDPQVCGPFAAPHILERSRPQWTGDTTLKHEWWRCLLTSVGIGPCKCEL